MKYGVVWHEEEMTEVSAVWIRIADTQLRLPSRRYFDEGGVGIFVSTHLGFLLKGMDDLAAEFAGVASVGAAGAHVCLCEGCGVVYPPLAFHHAQSWLIYLPSHTIIHPNISPADFGRCS